MTRVGFIQRGLISDPPGLFKGVLLSSLAVALAAFVRLSVEPWVEEVPFLTFFPAVLVVSLFAGWRWGLFATVSSAAAANYAFMEPSFAWAVSFPDIVATGMFLVSASLVLLTAEALRQSVRDIGRRVEREALMNGELQHRVKNNLAVVQGLARQTAKSVGAPAEFYEAFSGRLGALAQAHNALSDGDWENCNLGDLARAAVGVFDRDDATRVEGPACLIPPESSAPLALALHELGTNAIKYGALSRPSGYVSLTWTLANSSVLMRWMEIGGPSVEAPTRKGMGSRLLARQTGLSDVRLDFASEGLICEITIDGAVPA